MHLQARRPYPELCLKVNFHKRVRIREALGKANRMIRDLENSNKIFMTWLRRR